MVASLSANYDHQIIINEVEESEGIVCLRSVSTSSTTDTTGSHSGFRIPQGMSFSLLTGSFNFWPLTVHNLPSDPFLVPPCALTLGVLPTCR